MARSPRKSGDGGAAPDPDAGVSFETLLDEAAGLAARLESRELPLEEALDAYATGVRKLKACEARLRAVEERARLLARDGDGWRLEALDGGEEEDGGGDGEEDGESDDDY